jgi:hypothetical protein
MKRRWPAIMCCPTIPTSNLLAIRRNLAGSDRRAVSAAQPVVTPMYNTRATADVLIEAARGAGVTRFEL